MKKYFLIGTIFIVICLIYSFYYLISKVNELEYKNKILQNSNAKLTSILNETISTNQKVQILNNSTKEKLDTLKPDTSFYTWIDTNDSVSNTYNNLK